MMSVATPVVRFPDPSVDALFAHDDGGLTSVEHSRDVGEYDDDERAVATKRVAITTTVVHATSSTVEQEEEEPDSDYHPDEDEEEEESDDDESEDDEAHLQSLESQLDEHADEVDDYYLHRMLATRATLEGDEAAWVDSYIERQRKWKETHGGASIDEMELDLLRPTARACTKKQSSSTLRAAWNGRVSPLLPPSLRTQPTEFLLSLVGVGLFVAIALAVQFYVAFQAPVRS